MATSKNEKNLIKFSKYHGAGNDVIMVDNTSGELDLYLSNNLIVHQMCSRRFGIGSDGLIEIRKHAEHAFEMVFYRARGDKGTFGGNASRCSVAFAHELGLFSMNKVTFVGSDGVHCAVYNKTENEVEVSLGNVDGVAMVTHDEFFVDTGSPHHIIFLDPIDLGSYDVVKHGQQICDSDHYKPIGGTNVNFVSVVPTTGINIRTYERGVRGEIMACGTGAVASALAHEIRRDQLIRSSGRAPRDGVQEMQTHVSCPYGNLVVRYTNERGKNDFTKISLFGPVRKVYDGEYVIPQELLAVATDS